MVTNTLRYKEIVVRLIPFQNISTPPSDTLQASQNDAKAYSVLLYTNLPNFTTSDITVPPRGEPATIEGAPLVQIETIRILWGNYREYLNTFLEGEKSALLMRSRLFENMSPGLEKFFADPWNGAPRERIRIWWESDIPELRELPWEILFYDKKNADHELSFVRGTPSNPRPLVPLKDKVRLALIGIESQIPITLLQALEELDHEETWPFRLIRMHGSLRESLRLIASEGIEMVHIVAQGGLSLGYDGLLWLDQKEPPLSSSELSVLLLGSRVALISLSAPDLAQWYSSSLPITSLYRAFVHFHSANQSLPSVMVQIGPLRPPDNNTYDLGKAEKLEARTGAFWYDFYSVCSNTLSIEAALFLSQINAQEPDQNLRFPVPVALFLRQRLGLEFRNMDTSRGLGFGTETPNQVAVELEVTRRLLDELRAIDDYYSTQANESSLLPITETEPFRAASQHKEKLERDLISWLTLEDREK